MFYSFLMNELPSCFNPCSLFCSASCFSLFLQMWHLKTKIPFNSWKSSTIIHFNFFVSPSHYKIFPHHKMHHSIYNPHVAWIIIALQAVQFFKYSFKDYWMSEVTAAESHKITQAGRDLWCNPSWPHSRAQSWSYRVRMFSVLFSQVLRICEGKVHRPLGTLFQHLTALTMKDTVILESISHVLSAGEEPFLTVDFPPA